MQWTMVAFEACVLISLSLPSEVFVKLQISAAQREWSRSLVLSCCGGNPAEEDYDGRATSWYIKLIACLSPPKHTSNLFCNFQDIRLP
jgi:hypothetical protein